jgi:hypothetical protein
VLVGSEVGRGVLVGIGVKVGITASVSAMAVWTVCWEGAQADKKVAINNIMKAFDITYILPIIYQTPSDLLISGTPNDLFVL